MPYAVITTGGKQYKVSEGDIIAIDHITDIDTVTFPDVLLYVGDADTKIGSPILSDIVVTGKVLENLKGKKIRVAKFKAKAKYRRVTGFRASLTKVQIERIDFKDTKKSTKITS